MYDDKITNDLAKHYKEVLSKIGEDPEREGLLRTPERMAKAMQFLTHGYDINPDDLMKQAIFHEKFKKDLPLKLEIVFNEHLILKVLQL